MFRCALPGYGAYGLFLTNYPLVQYAFHFDQSLGLVARHLLNGDARPLGHDSRDIRLGHHRDAPVLLVHVLLGLLLVPTGLDQRLNLLLQLELFVSELAGFLEVLGPYRLVLLLGQSPIRINEMNEL